MAFSNEESMRHSDKHSYVTHEIRHKRHKIGMFFLKDLYKWAVWFAKILKVREVPLAALEFNIHRPPPAPPGSCNQPSATLPGD